MADHYHGEEMHVGGMTFGGYANHIMMREKFVLHIAESLAPGAVAPLLCAGITTRSPMQEWKVGSGQEVGVVGLGGFGYMAIKWVLGVGGHVVFLITSPRKAEDARRLGAGAVVILCDPEAMQAHRHSFDFILDTAAAPHDRDAFLTLRNCVRLLENAGLHACQSCGSGRLHLRHRRPRIARCLRARGGSGVRRLSTKGRALKRAPSMHDDE